MEKVKDTPLDRRLYRGSISTVRARLEEHVQWVASTVARRPGLALGTFPELREGPAHMLLGNDTVDFVRIDRSSRRIPSAHRPRNRNVSKCLVIGAGTSHTLHYRPARPVPEWHFPSDRADTPTEVRTICRPRQHCPGAGVARRSAEQDHADQDHADQDHADQDHADQDHAVEIMPTGPFPDAGTGRRRPRAGPPVAGSRPVRTHPGAAAARASRRVVGCTGGPRYSSARRIRLVAYGARLECVLG